MKMMEKKLAVETAGETEGARRASAVFPAGASAAGPPAALGAETEVVAKAQRRRFTAEYKRAERAEALVAIQKTLAIRLGTSLDSEPS